MKRLSLVSLFIPALFALSACGGGLGVDKGRGMVIAPAVSAGGNHTVALKDDGTVWTWGLDSSGQLGNSWTVADQHAPVKVGGLTGVTAVSAGGNHTVALKDDGTVWTWGNKSCCQFGDNTRIDAHIPVKVRGLAGVRAVSAGSGHTVALRDDGSVWAWGYNASGQLGDGTMIDKPAPVQVTRLAGVMAVSAGSEHTVALKDDGTVWAWGNNRHGRLGDGTTTSSSAAPVRVAGLKGVTAVSAAYGHTLALKGDGTVWAWGRNDKGQLGDGSHADWSTPVQVKGLARVRAVSAGGDRSMALKEDGTVWAWGGSHPNLPGEFSEPHAEIPAEVTGLAGVARISAGRNHAVALKDDGTVWAWGGNSFGQLGDGTSASRGTPARLAGFTVKVLATGLTGVKAVSAGNGYTVAMKEDGTIRAWGENSAGQLGDGTRIDKPAPVQVTGLTGVKMVSAGGIHTVALRDDGTVWTWGVDTSGHRLASHPNVPAPVPGLMGVTAVSAGRMHTVALKDDGTVRAWGGNDKGQLGEGTTASSSYIPVAVTGLAGVTAVSAGGDHTVALREDGTVWAWGSNGKGQLGDGTMIDKSAPVQVTGLAGVTAVSAGGDHTAALRKDGTVWAWGDNRLGILGDGTTTSSSAAPVQVAGLTRVRAVSAGYEHTVALRDDGTVWTWGVETAGQLGLGRLATHPNVPAPVPGLMGVKAVSAGRNHTVTLKDDGTVWACGSNASGQLGNASAGNSTCTFEPVRVTEPFEPFAAPRTR